MDTSLLTPKSLTCIALALLDPGGKGLLEVLALLKLHRST